MTIDEDILLKNIKSRSKDEWNSLYLRRTLFIICNAIIIICSSAIIVLTNIKKELIKNTIADFLQNKDWLPEIIVNSQKEVVDLLPTIVLSSLNSAQGPMIKQIIAWEKWDYQHQRVQQGIWRTWIGKILNLTIFIVVQL